MWTLIRRSRPVAVCCSIYVVLAMMRFGHFASLGPSHMSGTGSMDATVQVWWLAWTAFALSHGHNIFLTQWQNYPAGQNFGVNGSMLALGLLFMPITKLFGPLVTWNILLRLALAVSATSMCLVLRRWTAWWPAAFLGGLLYGFSAYMASNSSQDGYLFLIFVPCPPLVFLTLHEILVRQQWRPGRAGTLLGLVCSLQFFISAEILASTVVMGAIAVALFALACRHSLVVRSRYAVTAFAYSLGVGGLLLSFPAWFTLAGPQHIHGSPFTPSYFAIIPADLLSSIVPKGEWLAPKQLTSVAPSFQYGGALYLGLPLIVALVSFALFMHKQRTILFAGTMVLIAFILSLGPRLHVAGHLTSIPLPFAVFQHLPLLEGLFPSRLSLYTTMFAGGMFAIGIDELRRRLRQPDDRVGPSPRWRIVGPAAATAAIAVTVVIPLLPVNTSPASPTNVPAFFTSAAVKDIPPGSVVLAYPYPDILSTTYWTLFLPNHDVMLDQAVAGMRFKLLGGYGWFPSPSGQFGTTNPTVPEPQSVQSLFDVASTGGTATQRAFIERSNVTGDIRVFLRKYHVQTIIVLPFEGHPATVISHLTSAIGPPVESGGVTVWFHVKHRLLSSSP